MGRHCIRLLLVEDNPMDVKFVMDAFADAEGRYAVEFVKTLEQALASLADGQVDVVLLDLNLPDSASLETCWVVLEHATEIPVVVYSADAREESAVEVAHRGAQDYLIKGQTTHKQLVRAIQLAVARHPWRKRHHDWNVVPFGSSRLRPQWDEGKRELTVGGVLVKSFHQTSRNQSAILAAFEEEGWPMRIDDPLRQLGDVDPKERLRATIKSLNRHQQSQLLRFAADGTGEGIQWHFLNVQDRALTTSTG